MLGWQQNGQPREPKNNTKVHFKKIAKLRPNYQIFKFKSFKTSRKSIKFKFLVRSFLNTSKS